MVLKVLFASGWSAIALFFFWGTEAIFIYFAWHSRNASDTTFSAAALLLIFWTVVAALMTLRLYREAMALKTSVRGRS